MFTLFGKTHRHCDGIGRREFLTAGALAVGGLTLADLLRLEAAADIKSSEKAVINIHLDGGPPQMDTIDLKPQAPVEIRGEFKPIATNLVGFQVCELMPKLARIADKFTIVRNMQFKQQGHTSPELYTGFLTGNRPSIGSVVSKLRSNAGVIGSMPPHVAPRPQGVGRP